jgi:hypothetical protein
MGISDATAGKIVGHQSETTTSRYIHHAMDEALLSVADRLADRIESLLKAGEQSHTAQMAAKELRAAGRAEPFEFEDFEDDEMAAIIARRTA